MSTIISLVIYAFSFLIGGSNYSESNTTPIEQDKTTSFFHS